MSAISIATSQLEDAYARILDATEGGLRRGETDETPIRAAKAWRELTGGYIVDIASLFKTFDAAGHDEMIAVKGIPFTSICEHHLLPIEGEIHVVYLPDKQIIGLSKIPRLVHAFAHRIQVQERLTDQVADAMVEHLNPLGVAVVCEARHACMRLRGACSEGVMVTSVTRGAMREQPATRAEALALIGKR